MERLYTISERPLVIAHRGGGSENPENSIVAFQAMRDAGIVNVETDAHATSDGVAVISHDPMLDRTTDSPGIIASMTWAEVARARDLSGNPLLRVDEALEEFPDLIFNIDAKNDQVADPLVESVRRANAVERVCIASFSEKRLRHIRQSLPGVVTSAGVSAVVRLMVAAHMPMKLRRAILRGVPGPSSGTQAIQVPMFSRNIPVLTESFVEVAHDHGLAVHAWTIDDLNDVDALEDWGVDAIITDEPTTVRAHLSH